MPALSHPPKPGDPLHCTCGKPWPSGCEDAKAELMREYRSDPMALLIYLADRVARIAAAQPWLSPPDIVRQNFGWLPGHALVWAWPINRPLPRTAPPPENVPRHGANAGRWSR